MTLFLFAVVVFAAAVLVYIYREQTAYDKTVAHVRELESTVNVLRISLETHRRQVDEQTKRCLISAERAQHRLSEIDELLPQMEKKIVAKESSLSIRMQPMPVDVLERSFKKSNKAAGARR